VPFLRRQCIIDQVEQIANDGPVLAEVGMPQQAGIDRCSVDRIDRVHNDETSARLTRAGVPVHHLRELQCRSPDDAYSVKRSAHPWNALARSSKVSASSSGAAKTICRSLADPGGNPSALNSQIVSASNRLPITVCNHMDASGPALRQHVAQERLEVWPAPVHVRLGISSSMRFPRHER
jgi:hypothetical protein